MNTVDPLATSRRAERPPLRLIAREWGRIGCTGFGGPPAHISLLRELCVGRHDWLSADEFEDAIAATSLMPGPASTQLAIFTAWRLRGAPGALAGGVCFIVPGLALILALAVVFLAGSPPAWVRGAGAGAGAAVVVVALRAGVELAPASWRRSASRMRWLLYAALGAAATIAAGTWLVAVLLICGLIELAARARTRSSGALASLLPWPLAAVGVPAVGGLLALAWVAFKVGALSFGGGFVIIPVIHADAVDHYRWMSNGQFLNAVALGQVTPGPVVQTVAVVGYAAAGIGGALLASAVAFAPSFAFVMIGAGRFGRLRGDRRARSFLDGAGPAAIGAILGVTIPLAAALSQAWQYAVLGAAAVALLVIRRGVPLTLLGAAAIGALAALAGAPAPR